MDDDQEGRADFARRADIGERAMRLVCGDDLEHVYGIQEDRDAREEFASDVVSDVLTAVFGDPRVPQNRLDAQFLVDRAWRSYCGDAEDYDWVMDSELADSKGRPETVHPSLSDSGLDMLASQARTALDDPGGVGLNSPDRVGGTLEKQRTIDANQGFAIQRCDEIINLLNPSEWTRATAARALRVLGRHVAEVSDALILPGAYSDIGAAADVCQEAANAISDALDHVDSAIRSLENDDLEVAR